MKQVKMHIHILFVLFLTLLLHNACTKNGEAIINETFHISYKGADMPAYAHGNPSKKTFIIVLHGAGSFALSFRNGVFTSDLEKDYVLIYFDQRAQSMSQGNYTKTEDVITTMSEDLAVLVRVVKKRYGDDISLFLLGHSLGGMISANSIIQHDQKEYRGWVNIAGLMDTPSVKEERKKLLLNISAQQIQKETPLQEDWQKLKSNVTISEDYDQILSYASKSIQLIEEDDLVNRSNGSSKVFQAVVANNPVNWLISSLLNQPAQNALANNFTLLDRMEQVTIPTLWIYGAYDVSVPPALGRRAFDLVASEDKEFVLFDRSIHHPHDTEKDKFSELLSDFIEKLR